MPCLLGCLSAEKTEKNNRLTSKKGIKKREGRHTCGVCPIKHHVAHPAVDIHTTDVVGGGASVRGGGFKIKKKNILLQMVKGPAPEEIFDFERFSHAI